MDLNFNEVREYLLETNSIEEAEGILLHNILNKSNDTLKRKAVLDSLRQPDTSKSVSYSEKLDNLKISDLLGSFEADLKAEADTQATKRVVAEKVSETPEQTLDKLKFFDEVAEKELAELEKKRDYMQLKRLANKYELEKMNLIYKPDAETKAAESKARTAPIPFPKNSKETMSHLYELTEEHARKMAQNRAESLTYQKELEQLNTGKWSLNSSYLKEPESSSTHMKQSSYLSNITENIRGVDEQSVSSLAPTPQAPTPILGAKLNISRAETSEQQQARLEAILQSVASEDALQAQRQQIAALRQRTSQTDETLRQDPLMQGLTSAIGQSRHNQYEKLDPGARNINRNMKVPDYLEQWLGEETDQKGAGAPIRKSSSSDDRGGDNRGPSKVFVNNGLKSIQEPSDARYTEDVSPLRKGSREVRSSQEPSAAVQPAAAENDAVQQLITKLMDENRKLHEEKIVLQRDLQPRTAHPHAQAQYQQNGGLNQFRHQAQANAYPSPYSPERGPYSNYGGPTAPGPAPGRGFNSYQQPPGGYPGQPDPSQFGYGQFPQQPGPFPGPFQPPQQDPQQQAMLAQLQQMAEQMERENNKLMGQLSGGPVVSPGFPQQQAPMGLGPDMGPGMSPGMGNPNVPGGPRDINNASLYTLERDRQKNSGVVKPSRQELKHQEEVRKIQQDIEKLKYMGDLDQAQAEYEQAKSKRQKEMEHENWLTQQKQELQALKIQQVLAKEQRLLRLQQEDGLPGGGGSMKGGPLGIDTSAPVLDVSQLRAREDCGVGSTPVPLDLATGITLIVDGLILPRPMQTGGFFRIALGMFDKLGKALVRLTASKWQSWSQPTGNDKQEGALQQLGELLTRSLKLSENKVDLANARCLVELQCKEQMDSEQKWVGWGVVPVIRPADGPSAPINTTVSKNNVLLCNNAWRCVLRKTLSDPAIPDLLATPEQAEPSAWFLLRIVDSSVQQTASAWSLSDSDLRTEQQALNFYTDPRAPPQVSSPPAPTEKLLEQIPDIRALFHKDVSNSTVGFSSRGEMTSPVQPPTGFGFTTKGTMGAMKAVGIMKSRSKAKLLGAGGLENIPEGSSRKPSSSTQLPGASTRGGPPSSPPLGAFGGLSKRAPEPNAADQAHDDEKAKQMLRAADDKTYWFLGKPLGPCTDKYQKGDGVDVYFDSAMYLPDNTTVSRVTMRIFTADKEQVGEVHECFSLPNSPANSPVFNHKVELRSSGFNVTCTALIRIDTIDAATLLPASVGYSCIKLFASRDRVQPKTATELNACVNTGNFQLPLHAGRIPSHLQSLTDTMLSTLPKIPCASILVRVLPAPKSSDGISTMSKDEFPPAEWARLGLNLPAPTYVSGEYSGALCEPTDLETVCYRTKSQNAVESVESALVAALAGRPTEAAAFPPRPAGNEPDALTAWMKSLLPPQDQMRRTIEYSYAVPYSIETGLHVSVDSLYNMPDGGIFSSFSTLYKVISSTSPPGLFYKQPPLFDGVFYTKTHRLDAHNRAPQFTDGFCDYAPSSLTRNLYLLLDVRTLRIDAKKGLDDAKVTLEPPSQRKSYWTLLPLAFEKVPGQGYKYVQCGVYCAPLIEGIVPSDDVFRSPAPLQEIKTRLGARGKGSTNLKVVDGAMVVVKILNPLVKDLVLPDMTSSAPVVHTEFMHSLLTAAITGNSGSAARIDRFEMNKDIYPDGGSKSTAAQLPKSCQADLPGLVRLANKEFETVTGLVSR